MNNFAELIRLEKFIFKKVKYYSVRFKGKKHVETEFHDFLIRMYQVTGVQEDIGNLIVWIEEIGNKYGADRNRFFRHEAKGGEVSALPPSRRIMESLEIHVNSLRLYCLVANEHVVILFNGGIKTTNNPLNCPNVRQHFITANDLAKKIDLGFRSGEIQWNSDHTDIIIDPGFEMEL